MQERNKKNPFSHYFLGEEYAYVENTRNDIAYGKDEQSVFIYT